MHCHLPAFHSSNRGTWNDAEQLPSKDRSLSSCIRLPDIVLVRVGVIGDASNHEATSARVDARRLHLDAEGVLTELSDLVAAFAVLDNRVPCRDSSLVEKESGDVVFPEWAYPYRGWIIPSWLSGLVSIGLPILVYFLAQPRIKSVWDLSAAIMGT